MVSKKTIKRPSQEPLLRGWPPLIVAMSIAAAVLFLVFGCAAGQARQGTVEADFQAALVEAVSATVEAAVVKMGDVALEAGTVKTGNIGGGGDSVTSWILAGGIVVSAVFYPLIIRPSRRFLQDCLAKRKHVDRQPS